MLIALNKRRSIDILNGGGGGGGGGLVTYATISLFL